jgi:hypothetical protein
MKKKKFFLSFHVGAAKKCRQPVGQKLKKVGREREKEEGGKERIEGKETERGYGVEEQRKEKGEGGRGGWGKEERERE